MPSWIASPFRRSLSAYHRLLGRACFRLGSVQRARRHFERVLELKGDDYIAYLYLGRLAYSVGDYAGWRREFEHARRTAPDRFEKARHPFDLFEPLAAGTLQAETGERATWRAIRLSSVGGAPHNPRRDLDCELNSSNRRQDAVGLGGDVDPFNFLTEAEFDGCIDESESAESQAHGRRRFGDDFTSTEERERFCTLPPIDAGDIHDTDLDQLLRDLSR